MRPYLIEENENGRKQKIRVKFKWPGLGYKGESCSAGKGICVTLTLSKYVESIPLVGYDELENPNSIFNIIGDKLEITTLGKEDLLTSDGYIAIPDLMPISKELLIKPAIYKGQNNKVIVDIINTEN